MHGLTAQKERMRRERAAAERPAPKVAFWPLIRRFLPYYKPYLGTLIADLVCASLTTGAEIVLPVIVRMITDRAVDDPASLTVSTILGVGAVYLGLRILDAAAGYYMAANGHIMGTKMETDMRTDLFAHLQELSFSYYDNTRIGTLMSRFTSDLFDVTEFAHHCPEEFFIAGIKIIASFIILCTYNVPLTLIMFVSLPAMLACLHYFRHRMKESQRKQRVVVGELNSQIEDSLLGTRVVKAFHNEGEEERKFAHGNERFYDAKARFYRYMGSFNSVNRAFEGVMYIVAVVAGALFLRGGKIQPGDFVAYLMYATMLLTAIKKIVDFIEQFQRGLTGIERFCEIMDTEPEIADVPGAGELTVTAGSITFDDVTFKYNEDGEDVLSHIHFTIPSGQNYALVGPSGGGKTTLCNLIPRFYEITSGAITIDGQDIRSVTLRSLRDNIGIVQQDVYLFSGTVRENIAYGRPDATDDEIRTAARLAGADEFIDELPDGYDTYVGERGVKLSGGQKQRLSIARVFLKNPKILILDEATSALDNESEYLVQQSLRRLAAGRTTLTVAHRLTTIRRADKILVITKDGVAESGTHEELLAQNGLYADMLRRVEM